MFTVPRERLIHCCERVDAEGAMYRCQRGNYQLRGGLAVALEKQDVVSSPQLIQHPEHDGLWTASQICDSGWFNFLYEGKRKE